MSGAKHDSKTNVFSGISLTHSGNKILSGTGGAPATATTVDGQTADGIASTSK